MLALCSAGHGQEIVLQYIFASDLDPTTEAANVTGTSFGGLNDGTQPIRHSGGEGPRLDGSNLPIDDGTGSVSGRAFSRVFATDGAGNFQHYFQFGLTVDSGNLTFGSGSSVAFDSGHRNKSAEKYAVAYSTDGSASVWVRNDAPPPRGLQIQKRRR